MNLQKLKNKKETNCPPKPQLEQKQHSRETALDNWRTSIDAPIELSLLEPADLFEARERVNQRIADHLGQDYPHFLPNCKRVNIAFANSRPLPPKRNRSLPYHILSLRQYTDHADLTTLKQPKYSLTIEPQPLRHPKIQRYYTEQKTSNDTPAATISFDNL